MRNFLTLLFLAALWSPSFLFIKFGLQGFPPLTLATLRVGIAGMAVWGFLRLSGHTLPRSWSVWRHFLFIGLIGNAIPFSMFAMGETRADSGPAAILNSTTPIFTVIFAHLFLHDERLTLRRIGGVLIGFLGICLLFSTEWSGGGFKAGQIWGYAAFTTAALGYGITNAYIRRHLRGIPARVSATAQLLSATLFLLPTALIVEAPWTARPGLKSILAILALSLLGTSLALTVFFDLLRRTNATFVSMVTYMIPPGGIFLGFLFLNEEVHRNAILGCVLILLGVTFVNGALLQVTQQVVLNLIRGRKPMA